MNPVMTRPSPTPVRSLRWWALTAAALVVSVALVVAIIVSLRGPEMVDEVTVENPTAFSVHVSVSEGPDGAHLGLGVIGPETSSTFSEVIDAGDEWVFHFDSGRTSGGELGISRSDLAGDGWTVTVPDDVMAELAEDGAVPAPD